MKTHRPRVAVVLLPIIWLASDTLAADPLDNWQWRNPLPTANSLSAIAYGNSRFVAAGEAGSVFVSADGSNWSAFNTGVASGVSSMVFADGRFVLVGNLGAILVSSDGTVWSSKNSGTTNNLTGVTCGGGQFVAVGASGTALTSPDAETWTVRSTGISARSVAYGNGVFVAPVVGSPGSYSPNIVTSPDGISWTLRTTAAFDSSLLSIVFGNGVFVIGGERAGVGFYPYPYYWTSTNGVDWTQRSSPSSGRALQSARTLTSATNGLLVGVVLQPPSVDVPGNYIETSVDGVTWLRQATNVPVLVAGAHGAGQFVLVGSEGATAASAEGSQWAITGPGVRSLRTDIAYGSGVYVSVGSTYAFPAGSTTFKGDAILVSTDARSFRPLSSGPTNALSRVVFANNTFVAVGADGIILRSVDGTNWLRRGSGTFNHLFSIAHGDGVFVAVGNDGTILTSPDGLVWTRRFSPTSYHLYDVRWGGNRFVAVGYFGTILSSADGISWSVEYTDTADALFQVAYGNSRFVVTGERGTVLTSPDGSSWATFSTGVDASLRGLAFGNGIFVAAGSTTQGNVLLSSSDGTNWVNRNPGTFNGLYGARFLNDSFWLVGQRGSILESVQSIPIQLNSRLVSAETTIELTSSGGRQGAVFHLQKCTNDFVRQWAEVLTFTNGPGGLRFSDSSALPHCFYRLVAD